MTIKDYKSITETLQYIQELYQNTKIAEHAKELEDEIIADQIPF